MSDQPSPAAVNPEAIYASATAEVAQHALNGAIQLLAQARTRIAELEAQIATLTSKSENETPAS